MPEFPGGVAGLMRYLSENIKYPPEAAKNDIEGRVIVQFIIDETGQVGDIQVARPVSEELDAEAVRVVKSMPSLSLVARTVKPSQCGTPCPSILNSREIPLRHRTRQPCMAPPNSRERTINPRSSKPSIKPLNLLI